MANYAQNLVFNGIGTLTIVMPVAGPCFIEGKLSLPSLNAGSSGPSSVVVTVNQNGSPIYSGPAGAEGFKVDFTAALSDSMTVVTSSSAAVDTALNAVKMTVSVGSGV